MRHGIAASSSLEDRSVGAPFHGCPPRRSVFFSDEAARPTSDVPCRPRRSRFPEVVRRNCSRQTYDEDQDRFHRPLVKTNDLVRPETPSIDRCSLVSAFAPAISDKGGEPATVPAALPRTSRLPALFHPMSALAPRG